MSNKTLTQDELKGILKRPDAAERITQLIEQEGINPDLLRYGERKLPLLNELLVDPGSSIQAIRKKISICLALIRAGVNPQKIQRDKYCPLSLACCSVRNDVVELEPVILALLDAGSQPELCKQPHLLYVCGLISECKESGYLASPIHGYKEEGTDPCKKQALLNIIIALVKHGADINAFDKFTKYNPLILVVQTQASCIVPELLALGADVNLANGAGNTPLLFACGDVEVTGVKAHRSVEAVRQLLAAGADPAVRNANGRTPLSVASKSGHHEICYELYLALKARGEFYADDRKYFKDSPFKDNIDDTSGLPVAPAKPKRKPEGQAASWPIAGERLQRNYPDSQLGALILQLVQSEALADTRNTLFADTYCDTLHLGKTKKVSYVAGTIAITDDIYNKFFRVSFECERSGGNQDVMLCVEIPHKTDGTVPVTEAQAAILQMMPGLE